MTDYDDYAIVSKKEFLALKKELERIKRDPLSGSPAGETLQDSVDNLNKSINAMMGIFRDASEDMKGDEQDTTKIVKTLEPLAEKLDKIIDQNQKIAKGLVAVADMVKDKLEGIERIANSLDRSADGMSRYTDMRSNDMLQVPTDVPRVPQSSIAAQGMSRPTSSIPPLPGRSAPSPMMPPAPQPGRAPMPPPPPRPSM